LVKRKKSDRQKARAYYIGEDFLGDRLRRPIFPSYVRPYAGIAATIDTGTNSFDIGIRCPIFDETKP
jgi:hypothetical protein